MSSSRRRRHDFFLEAVGVDEAAAPAEEGFVWLFEDAASLAQDGDAAGKRAKKTEKVLVLGLTERARA